MSLRVDKMRPAEKTAWVVILVAFTILEVCAIRRADKNNEDVRVQQNEAFKVIADGLKGSIAASQTQFETTMGGINTTLNTANKTLSYRRAQGLYLVRE